MVLQRMLLDGGDQMRPSVAARSDAGRQIASDIRDGILAGRLRPGERLRQEQIAAEYRVSRTPVRDALKILSTEGLVELRVNSGAWVASRGKTNLLEQYLILERIEPVLLDSAITLYTESTVDSLSALAGRATRSTTLDDFLRCDREFHSLSYRPSPFTVLKELVSDSWVSTEVYRRTYLAQDFQRRKSVAVHEYALLMGAIRERDIRQAGELLRIQIRRSRIEVLRHVARDTSAYATAN